MDRELAEFNGGRVDRTSSKGVSEENLQRDFQNSESRTPLKTPTKETEVVFVANDSINGDAKVDIERVKSAFAGMNKEELLRYVNDPFWIRMRMFLFVSFWLLWVMMFVAAVAIIFMAPRCVAPAKQKWFQEGPIYEVNIEKFTANKGFSELVQKITYLEKMRVKGLIASSLLGTDETGNTKNFKSVNQKLGSLKDMETFLAAAKEKNIKVTMDFIPNHSSLEHEWFNSSVYKIPPYDSYYVWSKGNGNDENNKALPPNNWLTVTGKTAWTYHNVREEYYLHQFDENQPDLNFHSREVRQEFTDILSFWLNLGISGFNLDRAGYLLEDPSLEDELVKGSPGTTHDEYDFYLHGKTLNFQGTAELLADWRSLTESKAGFDGMLSINGEIPLLANVTANTRVVDLVRTRPLSDALERGLTATELADYLVRHVANVTGLVAVQAGSQKLRVADVFGPEWVDPLNMIALLLPAAPITYFGEELGLSSSAVSTFNWDDVNNKNDHFELYATVAKERDSLSIKHGNTNITALNDTFILSRWKAGSPGFILAYNMSPSNVTADLSVFAELPTDLAVHAVGSSDGEELYQIKQRVPRDAVNLPPQTAVLFTFVPVVNE